MGRRRTHHPPLIREAFVHYLGKILYLDKKDRLKHGRLSKQVLGNLSLQTGVHSEIIGRTLRNYIKRFNLFIRDPKATLKYKKRTQVNAILWDYYLDLLHAKGKVHPREQPAQSARQPQPAMQQPAVLEQWTIFTQDHMHPSDLTPDASHADGIVMMQGIDTAHEEDPLCMGIHALHLDFALPESIADDASDASDASGSLCSPAPEDEPKYPADWDSLLTPNPLLGAPPTFAETEHDPKAHDTPGTIWLSDVPGTPNYDDAPLDLPPPEEFHYPKMEEPPCAFPFLGFAFPMGMGF